MGTVRRSFFPATATLFLVLAAARLQEVKPSGIFELSLESLERRGADGAVSLRVCVKHYQVNVTAGPCTFHEFRTPPLRPGDLPQSTMAFDLNFTWPGQFSLIVEAWRSSETNNGSQVLVDRMIGQKTLPVGLEWTQDEMSSSRSLLRLKYRVYCSNNYYGPKCEHLCKPRDDKFGHYTCRADGGKSCLPGWTGDYCDKAICLPGCHQVYGMCEKPSECKCRFGWEGDFCDQCTRYPGCMHGTCSKPFQCQCNEGWGGFLCDQDLNYCTNHKPCKNGGTCTNTGQGFYTCSCTDQFMGENCEVLQNPCQRDPYPCRNGGLCENTSAGKFVCKCAPGFFGQHCETSANVCTQNSCLNGGSCMYESTGFVCNCLPGFTGILCENRDSPNCKPDHCLNGGTCLELPHSLQCSCPQGFSGAHCETPDSCSSHPCRNGGTCRPHPATGQPTCACPPPFSGRRCEDPPRRPGCASGPCANGGACRDRPGGGYHCDCRDGFAGRDCARRTCRPDPCLHGAFCNETADGFACLCPPGHRGDRCQHIADGGVGNASHLAANVSHRVSPSADEALSGRQVALIASLSTALPVVAVVLCCLLCAAFRRRRRQSKAPPARAKDCDFEVEDERLQNERNALQMNNKQCHNHVPQKIVNTLDRLPPKVSNEGPPKVLNVEAGKKVLEKSLMCTQRTLQKKDNTCGSSYSHTSPDWPSTKNNGIYVIEDHFRDCPNTKATVEVEKVLATEV